VAEMNMAKMIAGNLLLAELTGWKFVYSEQD